MHSSIQTWFGRFFAVDRADHCGVPFAWYSHLSICLTSLHWLTCVVDDPAWDRRAACRVMDPIAVCDRVLDFMENVVSAQRGRRAGPDDEDFDKDPFVRSVGVIHEFRERWLAELVAADHEAVVATTEATLQGHHGFHGDSVSYAALPMEAVFQGHDVWLTDIFSFMSRV